MRTEGTLNNLGRVSTFMDKLRTRATALPVGQQSEVLDTIVNLVGEEMLTAKLGGVNVSSNLEPLDRLLSREALREKSKERRLKEQKFMRETCSLFVKWAADKRASEIANSTATNADKIERLGQLMFGEDWKS